MNTSNYPKDHRSSIPVEVLVMMKDESGSDQIVEFVGLRSKLCSFLKEVVRVKRSARG